ncbi:transposase (ISmav2) [Legionella quateirensis]|uniref:Transposase (ISmav2) n=2 Tax=Legionella quateirensis TaxID=45072 RepID=A0ABR5RS13_9GAMM|nr:transposase (ISmav2) [Legionella quateirensis]
MLSMNWQSTQAETEKLKFIGDWLKAEFDFTDLCTRYGISRKTGYKLINRYKEEGELAIRPRSHARHHHPNATPHKKQKRLIELKYRYPKWGPEKLRDWLLLNEAHEDWPAVSTIGDILKKHGLVKPKKYRKRVVAHTEPFSECDAPNRIWSADFKGQFRVGKPYCYPLTITDNFSRFLLVCKGLVGPRTKETMDGFKQAFIEYGLPDFIRTDNGQPFAGLGIGALTSLSIWWLKLGIMPERIERGHPEQNGRHERMHRTLKEAVASPPKTNFAEQQNSFDIFRNEYNHERPHQALNGKRPADVYQASHKTYFDNMPEVTYPAHFEIRKVKTNGQIKWFNKRYFVSELLHGEPLGLEMIDDGRATLYFSKLKLGLIDARENKINRL